MTDIDAPTVRNQLLAAWNQWGKYGTAGIAPLPKKLRQWVGSLRLVQQQFFEDVLIHPGEFIQVFNFYAFIYFVDGGVEWAEFYYLCAGGCDEAPIGCAASSGEFGVDTLHGFYGGAGGID